MSRYINYSQVQELLGKYLLLKALFENLKVEFSTINAIEIDQFVSEKEKNSSLNEITVEIGAVGPVVENLLNAFNGLSHQEKCIIDKFYFQHMKWGEILQPEEHGDNSRRRAMDVRRMAIEKMTLAMRITPKQYEICMSKIKIERKKK